MIAQATANAAPPAPLTAASTVLEWFLCRCFDLGACPKGLREPAPTTDIPFRRSVAPARQEKLMMSGGRNFGLRSQPRRLSVLARVLDQNAAQQDHGIFSR